MFQIPQKADDLQDVVPVFRQRYGQEKTVGTMDLIHTDWMSDEHSDYGDMSQSDWDAHRDAQGGGDLEVCPKAWRSDSVSRLLLVR